MNSFLQEYGVIIVAVIVILAFVILAGLFGDQISEAVQNILTDFFNKSGATATP